MIRTLKRKFVFAAMLSVTILVVLLVSMTALVSYIQMEKAADRTLEQALSEERPGEPFSADGEQTPGPDARQGKQPLFGYRLDLGRNADPGMYFTAEQTESGELVRLELSFEARLSESEARALAQEAFDSGKQEGKLDAYKFRICELAQGGRRAALVDNTLQLRTLAQTVLGAAAVGAASLVVLFVILLLVSGRVIRPIAENMDRQREFVTNAGHEVKTPLAIIQANAETLEMLGGENKYIRNIKSQCTRMGELMRQLLLLSRADEGKAALKPESVDLSAALRADVEAFSEPAAQKGAEIETKVAENIMLTCDRDALEHILTILLDNATRYVNENGRIGVTLSSGARKTLCVRNTVEKLPDVKPDALFARFYRGDAARTQSRGGSGLGLSIAQSVAEQCRWKLKAEYGENTVAFIVEF